MTFPDTVISIAVEPKSQADIAKLDNGLAKLARKTPPSLYVPTSRAARHYLWYG
jgi:translation elongation factor EF-G